MFSILTDVPKLAKAKGAEVEQNNGKGPRVHFMPIQSYEIAVYSPLCQTLYKILINYSIPRYQESYSITTPYFQFD